MKHRPVEETGALHGGQNVAMQEFFCGEADIGRPAQSFCRGFSPVG
ncbi:MAG: hypothetical protein OXC26_08615 [Albidovulum sp.]|nr:hypothetical protein [Albidovulum sp.]